MVERRLTRRDQTGLPQPARAGLLAPASGARETNAVRETMAAGASFFTFLYTSPTPSTNGVFHSKPVTGSAGDWRWRVHTNNEAATTMNDADPSDTQSFLAWTPCSEPQHTRWLITLPQIGGHEEEWTHNEQCTHEHRYKLDGVDAQQAACPATQM